jgi:hypothetical protein
MKQHMCAIMAALGLAGCGQHLHLASPSFQKAPEITCVVFVQGDKISDEVAKAAVSICKERYHPLPVPQPPTKEEPKNESEKTKG